MSALQPLIGKVTFESEGAEEKIGDSHLINNLSQRLETFSNALK